MLSEYEMTQKGSICCSQPFKFVVVGEIGSGKTTLIRRFLADFSEDEAQHDSEEAKPTFVCDGHALVLNATVKHVKKDGSSVALKHGDIARQLWHKKYSKTKYLPLKLKLKPEYQKDISWDDIFVYLRKPSHHGITAHVPAKVVRPSSISTVQNTGENSYDSKVFSSPQKPARKFLYARSNSGDISSSLVRKMSSSGMRPSETEIIVDLWDTCGDRSLMWYRWYACTGADAVLLCVPLSSILQFKKTQYQGGDINMGQKDRISRSLQKFMCDEFLSDKTKRLDYRVPPVLLVGTKSDECAMVGEQRRSVFEIGEENVIDTIGLNLASEIGCCDFVHCSGLRGNGVASVFEAAIAVSLTMSGKYRTSNSVLQGVESGLSDCESSLSREVASPTYFKVHSVTKNGRPRSQEYEEKFVTDKEGSLSSAKTHDRLPPKIFFPPPPDSSPPSTRPNSSDSSFDQSESVSSSESTTEFKSIEETEPRLRSAQSFDYSCDRCNNESSTSAATTPIPVPRKRIQTERSIQTSTPISKVLSTTADTLPRDCYRKPQPMKMPIPRPRKSPNFPKHREYKTGQTRRESVFVKFLQAK